MYLDGGGRAAAGTDAAADRLDRHVLHVHGLEASRKHAGNSAAILSLAA